MSRDFTIFFASDMHGADKIWRKFVNAAKFYQAQVLLMGGDITGKAIVPIVHSTTGNYEVEFLGQRSSFTEEELPQVEQKIRYNGFYPYICNPNEIARIQQEPGYLDTVFKKVIKETLMAWFTIAKERLEPQGVPCFVMPGNDDGLFVDDVINTSPYVINPDMRIVSFDSYQMLSCSWTPHTPWHSPHECSEEELMAKLHQIVAQLQPNVPTIFNIHSPPYGIGLDYAPELRPDFSIVQHFGEARMTPVGSQTVRKLIEEVQPLVSLHGHIHESRGVKKIGHTTCVNPGSSYNDGVLFGCIVKLRENELRSVQLVRG